MAYSSGTATSSADLLTALTNFCTSNGWSLSAGVLSKGDTHILPTLSGVHIKLQLGTSAGFAAPGVMPAAFFPYVSLNNAWPVFYRLFEYVNGSAHTVVMMIREANVIEFKYLMFGNLENKVGTVWSGGQWIHGTYASQTTGSTSRQSNAGVKVDGYATEGGSDLESYSNGHGSLFTITDGYPNFGGNFMNGNSYLRCNMDGGTYKMNQSGDNNNFFGCVDAMRFARLFLIRNPNTWNGQSVLIPVHVYLGRASQTCSRLGTVAGVRFMRMDSYEPGDIITLGLDRWMVLPMYLRNATEPKGKKGEFDSTAITGHSGQMAYAIRYDGP